MSARSPSKLKDDDLTVTGPEVTKRARDYRGLARDYRGLARDYRGLASL